MNLTDGPARLLWLCIGWAAMALGAIGVVVPLLPTVPLVLVAAYAFSKSSPRLRLWLVQHRVFGKMIADWEAYGAIALRHKILACSVMTLVLLASFLAGVPVIILLVQLICMTAAASYILTRPSANSAKTSVAGGTVHKQN